MAKIVNIANYPPPNNPWVAPSSTDTHPSDHKKPNSGGGGT
jgi:hypothetical protein